MEWIDRRKHRPPNDVVICYTDGENYWTVKNISHDDWTHWTPIPDPLPRKVTIEIDERLAKRALEAKGCMTSGSCWQEIADACAAALERVK